MESLSNEIVEIKKVSTCPDLRITGNKLKTGCKALLNNNRAYTIYMSNDGNSVECFIMLQGKRKRIYNDNIVFFMTPYKLTGLIGWKVDL